MSRLRRGLRRLRRWLLRVVVTAVLLSGLLVAVLSRFLPWLEARPQQVEQWLSERLGETVEIQRLRAEWNGRGVRLDLDGLRIGATDGIMIDRAVLQLHAFTGWLPNEPLTSLHLLDPQVQLERSLTGDWRVSGLLSRGNSGEIDLSLLERVGELVLDRAVLKVDDASSGKTWRLPRLDARVRTQGGRLRLGLNAFASGTPPLGVIADFDLRANSGRVYLNLDAPQWSQWFGELMVEHGLPELAVLGEIWLEIEQREVVTVEANTRLMLLGQLTRSGEVTMRAEQSAVKPEPPELGLRISARRQADAWQLFMLDQEHDDAWLKLSARGERRTLQAAGWQIEHLMPWLLQAPASWLPAMDQGQRLRWQLREPRARLRGLQAAWGADQPTELALSIAAMGLNASGKEPGFAGVDLSIDGEADSFAIAVQSDDLAFDWPSSLRTVFHSALSGRMQLWKNEQAEWCLSLLQASVDDSDFNLDFNGDLCFNGDRPKVDLSVEVAPTDLTVAKRFWILNKMPETAVEWLDTAIESGRLDRGRLQLTGDLDQWPFADGSGRMEAIAELSELNLRFRDDWPPGTDLHGWARFVNKSMEVELAGQVDNIRVNRATGGIAQFRQALLELDIDAEAETASMLSFLRQTPLWKNLSKGLERVRMQGPGRIELGLHIPLKKNSADPEVDGRVVLDEVDLRQPEWGVSFEGAHGVVEISERGVRVEQMQVIHAGRPARFGLAVGSFVPDPANAVEATLSGRLDAEALLDTQPDLSWLRPYFKGNSLWQIDLNVPSAGIGSPELRLRSDLVGTSLELPAPLRKIDAVPMPIDLRVELGDVQKHIDLALGELMRLRGRLSDAQPFNGVAEFGLDAGVERPASGLAVIGSVPVLDASGWLALAGGGNGLIDSVDLSCGELDVGNRAFSETRLRWHSSNGTNLLQFDGQALQGELEIPPPLEQLQRGITARFERLYWPLLDDAKSADAGIQPGLLPPLHVHVADLRMGDAELGDTRLETFPDNGGMRIDQLQSRSAALELSARGFWGRQGEQEFSQLDAEFVSLDLGAMLKALGFSALVEGGQTVAALSARWPGAPSAFGLQHAEGSLNISVEDGTIPEVSPGAGRVLGLLSLTEIPRRLALDFSDFFKSGLAFNKIEGKFVLSDGSATTDGLRIDSPAAEITIRGRTGLRDHDYDQTMEVLPRAGSVLPVVGALAAGPAGAAIGAVAQAVLQKPFKQMTRTLYSVRGSWENPELELIERGPRRAGESDKSATKDAGPVEQHSAAPQSSAESEESGQSPAAQSKTASEPRSAASTEQSGEGE